MSPRGSRRGSLFAPPPPRPWARLQGSSPDHESRAAVQGGSSAKGMRPVHGFRQVINCKGAGPLCRVRIQGNCSGQAFRVVCLGQGFRTVASRKASGQMFRASIQGSCSAPGSGAAVLGKDERQLLEARAQDSCPEGKGSGQLLWARVRGNCSGQGFRVVVQGSCPGQLYDIFPHEYGNP